MVLAVQKTQNEATNLSNSAFHGAVKRTWTAFCSTTSIHGFKFINDAETNKIVRFVWILITAVSFLCASLMVSSFYDSYRSNPTRLNMESDHAPIGRLYFPAISICSEMMMNLNKAERYIEKLKLPPNTSIQQVVDGLAINYGFISDDQQFGSEEIQRMQSVLELNNLTIIDFMGNLRYSCDEMILRCRFHNEIVACNELFQISRTYFGYCCSFNLNQTGIKFTAKTGRGGLEDGLSVMLHYNTLDQLYSYSNGFNLLIHEPNAFPSAHAWSKHVPLHQEVFISMQPTEVFCSEAVKALSFENRQCVVGQEIVLEHFATYIGANCMLNYRVINMIKLCGCNTFFFPAANKSERVCSYTDIPCLSENFADIIGRYRNTQRICPDTCEDIDYEIQLSMTDLQTDIPTVDEFYKGISKNMSVAHIFLDAIVYRRIRQDLLSNTVTLISNLGSAFSLFVGVSMISIVEIFFYCTVIFRKFYLQELKARKKAQLNKKNKFSTKPT